MNTELNALLQQGEVVVTFTKKDGTVREMKCTLSESLIPPALVVELGEGTEPKKKKAENPDVRTVYDLDKLQWRSFRYDSVKSYHFTPLSVPPIKN